MGHPIDLDKLDPSEMLDAMIASLDGDEAKLANVIKVLIRLTSLASIEHRAGHRAAS
jgi:hypothetical protein